MQFIRFKAKAKFYKLKIHYYDENSDNLEDIDRSTLSLF